MSGIFGRVSSKTPSIRPLFELSKLTEHRGRDSAGLVIYHENQYRAHRAEQSGEKLLKKVIQGYPSVVVGINTPITNPNYAHQPVIRDGIAVFHDGIILNSDQLWTQIGQQAELAVDSEIFPALISSRLDAGDDLEPAVKFALQQLKGVATGAAILPKLGKLVLFSNNGSLYRGLQDTDLVFASERFALEQLAATGIQQVKGVEILDVPSTDRAIQEGGAQPHLARSLYQTNASSAEENLLEFPQPIFKRCTRCVLPETMPFIEFDDAGVCNYCLNYKVRNQPKPKEELFKLMEPYRRAQGEEVLVPFSGGRDSCYALHLIVNELQLKPITYTYDWGLVTDLGQRNISGVSAKLGVENITVMADIGKKRDNVRRNLLAWLKKPDLGMLSVLTAGDKHFFRYIETVKKQTGLNLNLWGINPLEVTHFKAGFLGVQPDFVEQKVYSSGLAKQLRYQSLRFGSMTKSPGYFNRSLWDTLSGEYYRSFTKKSDYYHIFDYWKWDEDQIDDILLNEYEWERATDTSTTWRIGDGTAAFYNYAYYTIAGFTEHDTFRSNQIREGQLTRDEALRLVQEENRPRYESLKWYFDLLGIDFKQAIQAVNNQPKLYQY
ncbi:MAG: hypothetical protein WBA28_05805 [Microbacteriaceae bacterium]